MSEPKIRVYGTAQNRTALGIVNAYLRLNPNTTLNALNEAFPETLFTSNAGLIFANADETAEPADGKPKKDIYFDEPDELLQLKDCKAKMFKTWTKGDYERFVEHAKQYGIIVAEKKTSSAFTKGGYRLADPETDQELDTPTPLLNKPEKSSTNKSDKAQSDKPAKKKTRWWLWLLLIILLIILLLLILRCCGCCSGTCNNKANTEQQSLANMNGNDANANANADADANATTSASSNADSNANADADTNTDAQQAANEAQQAVEQAVEEVKRTLNEKFANVQFQKGLAAVTPESKEALNMLASKLKEYPDATLKVIGHASKEGSLEFNQRISEARAKTIVDYLASQGVERSRLQYEGKGISEATGNADHDRRVEFVVNNN